MSINQAAEKRDPGSKPAAERLRRDQPARLDRGSLRSGGLGRKTTTTSLAVQPRIRLQNLTRGLTLIPLSEPAFACGLVLASDAMVVFSSPSLVQPGIDGSFAASWIRGMNIPRIVQKLHQNC